MFHHLSDSQPLVNITIQHLADQIDAVFGERDEGDSEWMVENLVDVVERVFLVDDRVEKNPKGPDVLLFASIGLALKDFGGSVI